MYSSAAVNAQPDPLDRLAPLIPGLDEHLVPTRRPVPAPGRSPGRRGRDRRRRRPETAGHPGHRPLQDPFPRPVRDLTPGFTSRTIVPDAPHLSRSDPPPANRGRAPPAPHQGSDAARNRLPTGSSSAPAAHSSLGRRSARCSPRTETAAAPASPPSLAPGTSSPTPTARDALPGVRSARCVHCSSSEPQPRHVGRPSLDRRARRPDPLRETPAGRPHRAGTGDPRAARAGRRTDFSPLFPPVAASPEERPAGGDRTRTLPLLARARPFLA